MFHSRTTSRLAAALALGLLALFLPACSIFEDTGPGGALSATSRDGGKALVPNYITAVYSYTDENSANVYLSDIPASRFADPLDTLADATGSIMHMHIFLIPEAGSTPIDRTACNVVFMNLVLTGKSSASTREATDTPVMGLYAGGGFLFPNGDPGDETLGGSVNEASNRLTRSTPDFTDLLGSGDLSGVFTAKLSESEARAVRAKMDYLLRRLPPPAMEPEAAAIPTPPVKGEKTPAK